MADENQFHQLLLQYEDLLGELQTQQALIKAASVLQTDELAIRLLEAYINTTERLFLEYKMLSD